MLDFYNNYTPYPPEPDLMKGLTDEERMKVALWTAVGYLVAIAIGLLICGLCFSSCTTPRAVEEHHHHYYEADTMAVKAQVDRQLTSWHEEMTQFFNERLEQFSASMTSNEHQQETITETVTVSLDSLGREIRTEQRTITRDISRELQQQEQRLTCEYEARLRVVIDSVDSIFQQRFDSLASHQTSDIDHQTSSTPLTSHLPWYQKLWNRLNEVLIIFLIAAFLWFTKKWWLKLLKLVV
jgi:hypothetical protein